MMTTEKSEMEIQSCITPIYPSDGKEHKLFLINDDVRDMLYVIIHLGDVFAITVDDRASLLSQTDKLGKALLKIGKMEELTKLKELLESKLLEGIIE